MLKELETLGIKKSFPKNETVFSQEDSANGFYYILNGEIKLLKQNPEGKEIEVSRLLCGDFLAEVIVFASDFYPVTAVCVRNTNVLFFKKSDVLAALQKDKKISLFLLELLAKKCLYLNSKLDTISLKNIRQRIIQYLFSICTGDGQCLLTLPMKKKDLANNFCITPEALSRNLKKLEDEELIQLHGKKIKILNCQKLKNFV